MKGFFFPFFSLLSQNLYSFFLKTGPRALFVSKICKKKSAPFWEKSHFDFRSIVLYLRRWNKKEGAIIVIFTFIKKLGRNWLNLQKADWYWQQLSKIACDLQKMPRAATSCHELPRASKRFQELPKASKSFQELPRAAKSC